MDPPGVQVLYRLDQLPEDGARIRLAVVALLLERIQQLAACRTQEPS
jgi:hypothetical protein